MLHFFRFIKSNLEINNMIHQNVKLGLMVTDIEPSPKDSNLEEQDRRKSRQRPYVNQQLVAVCLNNGNKLYLILMLYQR